MSDTRGSQETPHLVLFVGRVAVASIYFAVCGGALAMLDEATRQDVVGEDALPWLWFVPSLPAAIALACARTPLTIAFAVIVPVEAAGGLIVYHAVSSVASLGFLANGLFANLPAGLLLATPMRSTRVIGAVAAVAVASVSILWPGYLAVQWAMVYAEAERVVEYVEDTSAKTGNYPEDLSGFPATRKELRDRIHYDPSRTSGRAGYYVSYHVWTPNTSHWYVGNGRWLYYPD